MSDIHDLRAQYRQSVQDMAEECVRLVREDDYELGDAVHYYVVATTFSQTYLGMYMYFTLLGAMISAH